MEKKRKRLLYFVKLFHYGQRRKYTGEPYHNHCINVANMANAYSITSTAYEIGLCHDLFEDTLCTPNMLSIVLFICGYSRDKRKRIVLGTKQLTDVYTHKKYSNMNRAARKRREALRLSFCDYEVQTIKCCDIVDNTGSIIEHDHKFGIAYLAEKRFLLMIMNKGEKKAYELAIMCSEQPEWLKIP